MVECSETLRKKRLVDDACIKKLVTHKRARRGGGGGGGIPQTNALVGQSNFPERSSDKKCRKLDTKGL